MKVSVLGSGSGGNATLISSGRTAVLVDAGFRGKELSRRLRLAGTEPAALSAIFVTHEHTDHMLGALDLSQKFGVPLFCSHGTGAALGLDGSLFLPFVAVRAGCEEILGDLSFRAFATPHDANESLVFRFEDARASCVVATDLGHCDEAFLDFVRGSTAIAFEFNHDEDLLRDGPYHWSLKKRIAGGFGHLSNRQSAEALGRAAWPGLRQVVALHLSRQNNNPALVCATLSETLSRAGCQARFGCADQQTGYETFEV